MEATAAFDADKVMQAVRLLLEGIGEDPDRAGLKKTPARVARMYRELCEGLHRDPIQDIKPLPSDEHDEIVLVRDIPFNSICEHHLLPFTGRAHVAYIPRANRITGLSKLARVVEGEARRPQLQERMTSAIAEDIVQALNPRGVMVVVEAEHLCMTVRGVKKPGSVTVTSVVRGLFRESPATRAEALALMGKR
ncbi:MAG: GTP cyclohydrolase I FolE [Planctomycetota bacterium]